MTHIADRQVGEGVWRSLCGRFVYHEELLVEEAPKCKVCAVSRRKWARDFFVELLDSSGHLLISGYSGVLPSATIHAKDADTAATKLLVDSAWWEKGRAERVRVTTKTGEVLEFLTKDL